MAAITFSGFNNIDFSQVVSAIIAQERQPLATLQTQRSTLTTQNSAFGTLATKLSAVQSALAALGDGSGVAAVGVSSSDTGVGVTATGGSVEGTYEVVVSALARRQVTAAVTTYTSTDAVVATGGSLTLTGADGKSAVIAVDALMTVKELVEAINAAHDAPVTASLVQSTPGKYQIVLTGRHSGIAGAFTVAGEVLSFGPNVQQASNAELSINGLPISSATNTLTDVVPGATLTLARADAERTVTVSVSRDAGAAADGVKKFVTAYNDLMGFLNDQRTASTTGGPSIARDPLVQGLKNALRATLLAVHPNDGPYTRLAEVGLGFNQTGGMVLDEKLFASAIGANPSGVRTLFSGSGEGGGAFGTLDRLIKGYTQSGGLVADARDRLTAQVRSLATRIDAFEAQLELRRLTLQKEFQAADEAMSLLNKQMASLSSLGGQYRLF